MAGARQEWAASGAAAHLPQGLIYPDLVHSGMVETLVQNTNAFNQASRNAIRLVTQRRRGDFAQESFFKNVTNLVTRRQVTGSPNNPAATALTVPMDEHISVKLNRKIGPVDQTFDSFRKLGSDANLEVLSMLLGEQIAKAVQVDQLDAGLEALVAAIVQTAAAVDIGPGASPTGTLDTDTLVQGLATFGDAGSRVAIWVMHSKPFYDLVRDQIAANIDGVSNFNVAQATPVTLNRPVLVTDSAALVDTAGSPNTTPRYTTLGLTVDAAVLEDSEEEMLFTDVITGNENIVARLQGEFAYNVKIKGFRWDPANGGVNPDNTALATSTNWDAVMDDVKDNAGFAIRTR